VTNPTDLFEVIANRNTDEGRLLQAMRQLGAVTEPPGFWITIANSGDYPIRHRQLSVFCFFARHVKPGMTLAQLASMLKDSTWLWEGDITVVEDLGGSIPVQLTHDSTVFMFRVLGNLALPSDYAAVFLRVSGRIDLQSFVGLLRGDEVDEQPRRSVILEVGFAPAAVMET
jgi:hypothetical protein